MQINRFLYSVLIIPVAAALPGVISVTPVAASSSGGFVDKELHGIRYNYAFALSEDGSPDAYDLPVAGDQFSDNSAHKSPTKAFLLSLAVPGLGQYYYGSKLKPFAFIGVEAAAWLLHIDWHNQGEELTVEFEQFNRDHWYQNRYEDFLNRVYGVTDDELISAQEISHHLPDTRTQQYYEMTGKYDQFAWGWDDAVYNDTVTYQDWDSIPPQPITDPSNAPHSARRVQYETMRNNANDKLNKAGNMLMVVLANHLVSAVEAFLTTKSKNNSSPKSTDFSRWKVKPSLKSIYSRSDTPYLRLGYKF